ncbi:hypothetical protein CRG98_026922 [Punica granatum]|uniref:CCHC-type domain-containing protein n=1 Tax=Punica granatum TaxID=22663 RepID=A0A2I0JAJ0_PUNGR|nr:hypothetical protein CRG98_026922 [Punica granatum]
MVEGVSLSRQKSIAARDMVVANQTSHYRGPCSRDFEYPSRSETYTVGILALSVDPVDPFFDLGFPSVTVAASDGAIAVVKGGRDRWAWRWLLGFHERRRRLGFSGGGVLRVSQGSGRVRPSGLGLGSSPLSQTSAQFDRPYDQFDWFDSGLIGSGGATADIDASEVKEKYEWWEKTNRLSPMLMKSRVSKSIRGAVGEVTRAKDFLKASKEQFAKSDKALASTLMKRLTSKTFDSSKGVRAHITKMRDLAAQLKTLKIDISEPFLVHFILNSLPAEYGSFKISYNTHKEEWSITELLTTCVQEEERMKHDKPEVAHLATRPKGKGKKDHGKRQYKVPPKMDGSKVKCFFCRKDGHVKKDCPKYKKWLEKIESDFDVGPKEDPTTFSQAMSEDNSSFWLDAMKDELDSMAKNGVWDLVELPEGAVAIGCK